MKGRVNGALGSRVGHAMSRRGLSNLLESPHIQSRRGVEKPLFKELAALAKAGFASYEEQGFL